MNASEAEIYKEAIRDSFITINLIRVGIVFFVLTLIRILVTFYKYIIRMADFYRSRAMAIDLSGIEKLERVKTFSDVFATDKFNFEQDDTGKDLFTILKTAFGAAKDK